MQRLNVGILRVCDEDPLLRVPTGCGMPQERVCCFDDQHTRLAARLMQGTQPRRLVVLDRDKQLRALSGWVTRRSRRPTTG
jgi:hypothetical protein